MAKRREVYRQIYKREEISCFEVTQNLAAVFIGTVLWGVGGEILHFLFKFDWLIDRLID
jgi:hypothetical protein